MTDLDRLDALAAKVESDEWYAPESVQFATRDERHFIAACDPATIRSLVAENKALRDLLLTAAEFGHNVAVAGRGGVGHIGSFEECPQTLCVNVRAALHQKDGAS